MITARQITVFRAVCKNMSMTKAAEELYVSQPSVTKTIHDIEEEYGITLFERRNRRLYLTQSGLMLLDYANQIIDLLEVTDKRMQSRASQKMIRIGASITVGTSVLCWTVRDYVKEHNDVKVEAIVDNTNVIEQSLLDGKLDMAFVEGRIASPEINSEEISPIDIVLVVNKAHEFYGRNDLTLSDLEGKDFIVREKGSRTREKFTMAMEQNNIRWNVAWECHNTQAIKNAVDAGLGIGVLSRLSVRNRIETGRVHTLNVFQEPLQIYVKLAYKNNKYFTQELEDFRDFAIERMRREQEYNP